MSALYPVLAAAVVLAHMAFVLFAAAGGFLVLRWPNVAWLHLPALAWAAFVELTGRICPLTPLENALRSAAGLEPYGTDFVARYLFPMLYPVGLTRTAQVTIGALLLATNAGVYAFVLMKRSRRRRTPQ